MLTGIFLGHMLHTCTCGITLLAEQYIRYSFYINSLSSCGEWAQANESASHYLLCAAFSA